MLESAEISSGKLMNSNRMRRSQSGVPLNDSAERNYPLVIAQETMQRQIFLARGPIEIADTAPIHSILSSGEIFPNYSAKGHDNAPDFEGLDSGITKRHQLLSVQEEAKLQEAA